jgi:ABC-type transporter Mla subunit MlaD
MQTAKSLLTCALLAALTAGAVMMCLLVDEARTVISALPETVERQIREQGDSTRRAALTAIVATRRDLLARVDNLTSVTDSQLTAMLSSLDAQLGRANDSLSRFVTVAEGAAPVLENAAGISRQVNDALPLFTDCDHNPDCAFNRYVGTARGIEKMSAAVGAAAPKLAESAVENGRNLAGITADVHSLTGRIAAPKSFLGRLWDGIKVASAAATHLF